MNSCNWRISILWDTKKVAIFKRTRRIYVNLSSRRFKTLSYSFTLWDRDHPEKNHLVLQHLITLGWLLEFQVSVRAKLASIVPRSEKERIFLSEKQRWEKYPSPFGGLENWKKEGLGPQTFVRVGQREKGAALSSICNFSRRVRRKGFLTEVFPLVIAQHIPNILWKYNLLLNLEVVWIF